MIDTKMNILSALFKILKMDDFENDLKHLKLLLELIMVPLLNTIYAY